MSPAATAPPAEPEVVPEFARYTYRLRPSDRARRALLAEWDRCRWVWNRCVAESKAAHQAGEKIGPAGLDKMLTGWRADRRWLRAGASVPQQQIIRDFGRSRAKALKDIKRRMARRKPPNGEPGSKGYQKAKKQAARAANKVARQRQDTARKWAKTMVTDFDQIAVEDFRPRFLAKTTMARKAADAAIGATKRALVEMGRKHARDVRLVHPKHTTTDCANCGARTKHRLPLSERTYTCTLCGVSRPRDKNSAQVMPIRAGFVPAPDDRARPAGPPGRQAA